MSKPRFAKQLNIDECLATMESPDRIAQVIFEIGQCFRSYGNPKVLPVSKLQPWAQYLPHLLRLGVIEEWAVSPKRIEIELLPPHRLWISVDEAVSRLREEMAKSEHPMSVIDAYLRRYGHNPGVAHALQAERRRLIDCPNLAEYVRERRGARAWGWVRKSPGLSWESFVMWLREEDDPEKIQEALLRLPIPYKGTTAQLAVGRRDAWALACAHTVTDIEFILDRLPVAGAY